ncbi:MAG: UDP-glucose 4-epimerase GalE [Acidothermaceae bacterium]
MKVLITGGAGFIGSTVASACIDAGMTPVVVDNLSTGRREFVADRIFYAGDIADRALVRKVFDEHTDISAIVHCAAKIVVPESTERPLDYYENNVGNTIVLLDELLARGVERFIFSSSASIYAPNADLTVDESSQLDPKSPYAMTKFIVERILEDVARATPLRVLSLRYFNPVGADPQRRTGLQTARPTHALGKLIEAYETGTPFTITGTDWPTRDGSAIRDYIHVWDLAQAHIAALQRFDDAVPYTGYQVVNVGTGTGTTVRELVAAFRSVVGDLDVREAGARPGDVVGCYTTSAKAAELLQWAATKTLDDGVRDSLDWAKLRPSLLGN